MYYQLHHEDRRNRVDNFLRGGSEGNEHVVTQDDTLESIANQYNTTIQSLLDSNKQLKGTDILKPGQTLQIPLQQTLQTASDAMEISKQNPFPGGFDFSSIEAHKGMFDGEVIAAHRVPLTAQQFHINDHGFAIIQHDEMASFIRESLSRQVEVTTNPAVDLKVFVSVGRPVSDESGLSGLHLSPDQFELGDPGEVIIKSSDFSYQLESAFADTNEQLMYYYCSIMKPMME